MKTGKRLHRNSHRTAAITDSNPQVKTLTPTSQNMESDPEVVAQDMGARREMTDFLQARGTPSLSSLATVAETSAEIDTMS